MARRAPRLAVRLLVVAPAAAVAVRALQRAGFLGAVAVGAVAVLAVLTRAQADHSGVGGWLRRWQNLHTFPLFLEDLKGHVSRMLCVDALEHIFGGHPAGRDDLMYHRPVWEGDSRVGGLYSSVAQHLNVVFLFSTSQ